jgi:hypothetical protein
MGGEDDTERHVYRVGDYGGLSLRWARSIDSDERDY